MTLSFSTQIGGKPNYFVEKIWKWLVDSGNQAFENTSASYERGYNDLIPCQYIEQENIHYHKPKLHTIRRDEHDRWKAGNAIHLVINNRTPDRFQFAPDFKCTGTQTFETNNRFGAASFEVLIDGKIFAQKHYGHDHDKNPEGLEQLAINDGFETVDDFIAYFQNFKGKLIHWTDKRY